MNESDILTLARKLKDIQDSLARIETRLTPARPSREEIQEAASDLLYRARFAPRGVRYFDPYADPQPARLDGAP